MKFNIQFLFYFLYIKIFIVKLIHQDFLHMSVYLIKKIEIKNHFFYLSEIRISKVYMRLCHVNITNGFIADEKTLCLFK